MHRSGRARTQGRVHRIRGRPGSLAPRTGRQARPALAPARERARAARERHRGAGSARVHGVRIGWRQGVHRDHRMECSSSASKRRTEVTTATSSRLNGPVANLDHVLARSPKLLRYRARGFTLSSKPRGPLGRGRLWRGFCRFRRGMGRRRRPLLRGRRSCRRLFPCRRR